MSHNRWATRHSRRGISLLEIILAIGIMGASLAALSSVVMLGADAALDAKDRVMAQMLCEQQIAEVVLNNLTPVPYSNRPLVVPGSSTQFVASMQSQPGPIQGVLAVQVTVASDQSGGAQNPVQVSLVRWMVDPLLGLEQLEAEEEAAAAAEAEAAAGAGGDAGAGASGGPI